MIGHSLQKDGDNMSSYGSSAVLDTIFLRHIFMHSCVDLDTLGELFGVSSQRTNSSSPADVHTHPVNFFVVCFFFNFRVLLKVQVLIEWMSNYKAGRII